jgi:hypothetical protein
MDQPKLRPRPGRVSMVVVACVVAGAGCGSDAGGTTAPELRQVLIQVPNEMDLDLLAPPDGGAGAVSPIAQIKLVFNQLLDGDKIEDVLDGGGVRGKTDVASLTWSGAPAGAPPIVAVTTYNPTGATGVTMPAPSVLVSPDPGLPSGATVVLALAREKITSKKGTPFAGPAQQTLQTEPFSATASFMDGDTLGPATQIHLAFSNVPGDGAAAAITVTAGGVAVPLDVKPDDMDHRVLVVTPRAGAWMIGSGYMLAVATTAADLFGVKLPAAMSAGFSVAEGGAGGPDAGAGGPDAGAGGDGGVNADGAAPDGAPGPDAAVDAAVDGAASDAGGDGGTDVTTSG